MSPTFHERKRLRKERYLTWVKGWRKRPCSFCSKEDVRLAFCPTCGGSGVERFQGPKSEPIPQLNQSGDPSVPL
jgi:hypothetical protein